MAEPGAERTRARLVEELELMGFEVAHEPGDERQAETLVTDRSARGVVWLRRDNGARIWVLEQEGDSVHSRELTDDNSGSPDLLALRSAELLRGRLLGTPEERLAEEAAWSSGGAPSNWGASLGPALVMGSTANAVLAVTGDLVWRPVPDVGVGPFVLGSVTANRWTVGPADYEERQLWVGAKCRVTWLHSADGAWSADVSFLGGARTLFIDREAPPNQHSDHSITGPLLGIGAGASRHFGSALRLSWDATLGVGFPLERTMAEDEEQGRGRGMRREETAAPADFYLVLSILGGFDW